MAGLEGTIGVLAFRQLGLITRQQLLELGLTRHAIQRRITRGLLLRVHPGVYRVAGAPITFEQLLMAALLAAGPGSAVSHRAAGWLWGLEGVRAGRPEISVPHGRKVRLKGVIVHRTKTLPGRDVTRRRGLVVTTPARTIADLAGLLAPIALEDALDDARRRKLVTNESLQRQIKPRVRNTGVLRRLVSERENGKVSGSSKENDLRRLLRSAGLPQPVEQHEIRTPDGEFVACPDFAYPDVRLAIEYDGAHHADRRQWQTDLVRQNRLINAGWRVLRYTYNDLVHRPDEVVAEIREALNLVS